MFLGVGGRGYKREERRKLNPGQQGTVGRFTLRHDGVGVTSDGQKQMITRHLTIFQGGKEIAQLEPARWFFAKHETQPTTEVAMRRAPGADLYRELSSFEV